MQDLVDQLLALIRAGEGRRQIERVDVDLDDLVLREVRRATRNGLTVDTSGVSGGRVRGDAVALGQVVRNLVDNARRHADSTLKISVGEAGGRVQLTVEDDGPGIAAADRGRVFERFVRLDEARARDAGGSGLGLAIVREIAQAHGAALAIGEGELGRGCRVTLSFPGVD